MNRPAGRPARPAMPDWLAGTGTDWLARPAWLAAGSVATSHLSHPARAPSPESHSFFLFFR